MLLLVLFPPYAFCRMMGIDPLQSVNNTPILKPSTTQRTRGSKMAIPEKKDSRVPASIRNHPAVRYCVLGDEEGSDYKFWIELHSGWKFTQGRAENCTGIGCDTVADFRYASAKKV